MYIYIYIYAHGKGGARRYDPQLDPSVTLDT